MESLIELGQTPSNEICAEVGINNYEIIAKKNCQRFINLLRKTFGPEPENTKLKIKQFNNDFGIYYEVVYIYDPNNKTSSNYAFNCEHNAPLNWNE